ncbi:MAG: hypothetical protein J3Q66DRAFT_440222 [Benniella sp.]|nr:MAG: hypothetical protein J3Q66DRAFT_440222 [Benniella sp.]
MVTTQSFRLLGKPDTKDITCELVGEENVVFWEDIEQIFPGVKYIANGNTVISLMRDSNRKRISPACIKHYPGVVLDVVLSPIAGDGPLTSTTEIQDVSLTEDQSGASAATLNLEPDIIQRLASALSPEIQTQLRFTSDGYDLITQAINDGELDSPALIKKCLLELKAEMGKNRTLSDRIVKLQEQTKRFKQQAPLQTHVDTLLADTYESYKHPIPRLFVVLPQDITSWNTTDLFLNKFRLYFLCECGEHTRTTSSKVSCHIHFAKHEGYEVICSKELFRRFRSNILSTLNVLKIGISEAGVTMPVLTHLIRPGAIDTTTVSPDKLETMEHMMNQVIDHLESISVDEENNDTAGGMNLTELEPFLKNNRSVALGNLYRTVNSNGHVRWICIDHYREMHQEKATNAFRDTVVSLDGLFDENLGYVKVALRSRDQADRFHLALEEAKFIYELKIDLCWDTTRSDFKRLRDALVQTNVGVLELDLNNRDGSASDTTNRNQHHHPIFDIMRHPSIKSITLVSPPKDFVKKSNLPSFKDDFSSLKHLDVDLTMLGSDVPGLKDMIAKAPNLAHLVLSRDFGRALSAFRAIAEHQTYPVTFPDEQLRILPPTNGRPQPIGEVEDMTALLKALAGRIETVDLCQEELESIVAAFAAGTRSRLEELTVRRVGRNLGKRCIEELVSIVARSKLCKLDIDLEDEEERVSILKSIQWEHIRDLTIRMDEESQGMGPLKAIADGIKVSGRSDLDRFGVCYGPPRTILPVAQEQLLQSIVASTSLVRLQVEATMTLNQVQSLLDSAKVSRLQHLILSCEDFKSTEVDTLLNKLEQATQLQSVTLLGAITTNAQTDRLKVRKVILRNKVGPLDPVNTDVHDLVEVSPVEVSVEVSVEIPEGNPFEPKNTTAGKKRRAPRLKTSRSSSGSNNSTFSSGYYTPYYQGHGVEIY